MSETVLYLSPHYDDVAFSCPLHLLSQIKRGRRVVVATIFSEADDSEEGKNLYQARKEEDSKALSILGADQLPLGLRDAPYRDSQYRSFSDIVLSDLSSDQATLVKVQERIEPIATEMKPVEILAPLGVGTHIDHLLVHEAIRSLDQFAPIVRFYEDRPYAFAGGAVQFRLKQLGIDFSKPPPITWNQFADSFLQAPYVERFLGDEERVEVLSHLKSRWEECPAPSRSGEYEEISAKEKEDSERCFQAATAYRTQFQDFLGTHAEKTSGKMKERLWVFAS